jgi:hypothetical protein
MIPVTPILCHNHSKKQEKRNLGAKWHLMRREESFCTNDENGIKRI